MLTLVLAAFDIVVSYTIFYWRLTPHFTGLQGLYAAMGTLATVQAPPQATSTVGVIGVTQEVFDLVFISGIVTVALGRAFR